MPGEICWSWGPHPLLKPILLYFFYVSKHYSIQCFTALCFSWWFQYQDTMDRSVQISILVDDSDDLCYPPCSWSTPPGLETGAWYSMYPKECLFPDWGVGVQVHHLASTDTTLPEEGEHDLLLLGRRRKSRFPFGLFWYHCGGRWEHCLLPLGRR